METFEQLCQQRRSIRKYTAQPVEKEKLDYILRCALMSPSGKRLNPWEFYVLTDAGKLRRLSACRTYGSGMFNTAMAAIVVALDASRYVNGLLAQTLEPMYFLVREFVGVVWAAFLVFVAQRDDTEHIEVLGNTRQRSD